MFKKLIALFIVAALTLPFLASCEKEPTPADVWNSATEILANSENLSLSSSVIFGNYNINLDYVGNRTTGVKSYDIKFDDNHYPIYTDGTKTYYTADDLKFSVKSNEDSDIIREFMDFELTNAERFKLVDDKIINPLLEVTESSKKLTFQLSGADFAYIFAPDENISFEQTAISFDLDIENNIKNILITTKATGTEFYGIPLFDAQNEAKNLNITINNVDFTGAKSPSEPSDKNEYPELVALAKTYPTGLFQSMKDSSKMQVKADITVDVVLASIKCTVVANTTTQQIEGNISTRTESTTTVDMLGSKNTTTEDTYTNGKDGYVYYTDPENGNHKIKNEDSATSSDDILSKLTSYDDLEGLFANTEAAGSTITVDISGETLQKILNESDSSDLELGMPIDMSTMKVGDSTLIIKLKKGLIETVTMDIALETSGDLLDTGTQQTIKIDISLTVTYETLMENYVVKAPEGWENYEDWT